MSPMIKAQSISTLFLKFSRLAAKTIKPSTNTMIAPLASENPVATVDKKIKKKVKSFL
jgi:hypothetical protein